MTLVVIIVLWTWGLTPLWVNIVGTVLLGLEILAKFIKVLVEVLNEDN